MSWKAVKTHMERNFQCHVSVQGMIKLYKKHKLTGQVDDYKRSGRPKCTSRREDRTIRKECLRDRFATLNILHRRLKISLGRRISQMTISRRLRHFGLKCYVPSRKPLLNKTQRKKRLLWARGHRHFKVPDWNQVLFSDESIFRCFSNRRRMKVRRLTHERYRHYCLQATVKHPPQVHVWGMISPNGPGILKRVEGTLNSQRYQQNIINDIKEHGSCLVFPRRHFTFQQDNAPAHNSRSTHAFLADKGVNLLDWPGNSPDMNPIETVWDIIGKKIAKDMPTSSKQLWESVKKHWYGLNKNTLQPLYNSMPNRIRAVIRNKGGATPY